MKKIVSILLAALFLFGILSGCGKKNPGDDEGNKPAGVYVPKTSEQTEAIVFGLEGADGVFSPFFSSSAYDSEIVGMTQLGMITSDGSGKYVYGDDEACVTKDLNIVYLDSNNNPIKSASNAAYTRYDFLIKKGIKFSDGVELTIKDVLFNLYVYLDPVYTGNATIYSTDIVGLSEYMTQSSDENANQALEENSVTNANIRLYRIYNWLNNQALLKDTPNGRYEELTAEQKKNYVTGLDSYETEIKGDIEFFLPEYQQEIEGNYQTAMSSFNEDRKSTYDFDEGEYWQSFLYMYGIIDIAYNTKGEPVKKTVTDSDGNEVQLYTFNFNDDPTMTNQCKWVKEYIEEYDEENWQKMSGDTEEEKHANAKQEAAIDLVYSTNVGKEVDGAFDWEYERFAITILSSASTNTLLTQIQADEKSKLIDLAAGETQIRSVSGITTSKVTSFTNENQKTYDLDGTYDVLSIKIKKIDPKAIWNFAFAVAPMHYYSYEGAGDEGEYNVNNNFGVIYKSTSFMNDVLKASEKLGVPVGAGPYKASKEKGLGNNELYPSKNEFKKDNRIYYERNTYFDMVDGVVGGTIQNAKIKYLQYKVVNSNFLLDSLLKKEIDVGNPSAKQENINTVNSNSSFLKSETIRTNGYGYVGINAGKIPDVWMRRAIMKAMDTSIISNGYYNGGLCELIYRPMSAESWAYPKNDAAKRPYSFIDASGDTIDYVYDSSGSSILDMLEKKGGYRVGNGKVLADPDGNSLPKITFTVAGDSNDHPAWHMFKQAEEVLEKIGFQIDVKTDSFALQKLAKGDLTVWAAAWSSTIDPDMYQVYHKDSAAGSTLNWGYREIKQDKVKYSYEWSVIEKLSDLIDRGRSFIDEATRSDIYAQALDLVMELAVEMPTYQRNDLTVYNKTKIDSTTLNQNPTSYEGLFAKIWEVGYVA